MCVCVCVRVRVLYYVVVCGAGERVSNLRPVSCPPAFKTLKYSDFYVRACVCVCVCSYTSHNVTTFVNVNMTIGKKFKPR